MKSKNFFKHLIIIIFCIFSVFPIYWLLVSSFKVGPEIFNHSLLPSSLNFENYKLAFKSLPMGRMLLNSLIISLTTGLVQMVVAILFSFSLKMWDFKGKDLVFFFTQFAWLIPIQAIMIPNYVEIVNFGLANTLTGIILPELCSVLANIRIYQSFKSFPNALIEAARLDGASNFKILVKIILPSIKSSLYSMGIILIISSWNNYLWPMIVASSQEKLPIQIGLKTFLMAESEMWGPAMAAASISMLPILIIYILMSRKLMDSFMKGGEK